MNKTELRKLIGQFGLITVVGPHAKTDYPGWIREVDANGNVYFTCTDNFGFIFLHKDIRKFEPKPDPAIKK